MKEHIYKFDAFAMCIYVHLRKLLYLQCDNTTTKSLPFPHTLDFHTKYMNGDYSSCITISLLNKLLAICVCDTTVGHKIMPKGS